jgi:hypothetical protein
MGYSAAVVTSQVIAQLGLSVRDAAGVPTYSTALGDSSYATEEISRAVASAGTLIMQAICETEGHAHRGLFTTESAVTNGSQLPTHYGPIGIPRITPYQGAAYTISGIRKSIDRINSFRANVDNRYSLVDHDRLSSGSHSKLAGFYAVDNNTFYHTGYSAVADIANFVEADVTKLPDSYHPLGIALSIANSQEGRR